MSAHSVHLVVGKRYLNRLGEVVEITGKSRFSTHPYQGSDDDQYRHNGMIGFFKEHDLDLIEETEKETPLRLSPWGQVFESALTGFRKAA